MSTQAEKPQAQGQVGNPFKGGAGFLRDVIAESKRVVWPTMPDTRAATATVLIMVSILGLYLGGVDFLASQFMSILPF